MESIGTHGASLVVRVFPLACLPREGRITTHISTRFSDNGCLLWWLPRITAACQEQHNS
jgi:hypothetical protein